MQNTPLQFLQRPLVAFLFQIKPATFSFPLREPIRHPRKCMSLQEEKRYENKNLFTCSWYSAPHISKTDNVGSPTTNLSTSMRAPRGSTISFSTLPAPPAPWSWIETMGFSPFPPNSRSTPKVRMVIGICCYNKFWCWTRTPPDNTIEFLTHLCVSPLHCRKVKLRSILTSYHARCRPTTKSINSIN